MTDLLQVRGVGPAMAKDLAARGIKTARGLANAQLDVLTTVPRIGLVRGRTLIAAAEALLTDRGEPVLVPPITQTAEAPPDSPAPDKKKKKKKKRDKTSKKERAARKEAKAAARKAEKARKDGKTSRKKDKTPRDKDKKRDGKSARAKMKKAGKSASARGKRDSG
jgi:hypothetical protein